MTTTSIVLAAGQGTRMHSKLPKVLHQLAGKPMVWHALRLVDGLVDQPPVLVVGYRAEEVRKVVGEGVQYALQKEQLGTGHAVASAKSHLEDFEGVVLVTFADMPLLRRDSLERLLAMHRSGKSPVTMTSFNGQPGSSFGRVIRNESGHVQAIVEAADASPEELAITEYNVSAYAFDARWLWQALAAIPMSAKGEYYLTDVIGLAVEQGYAVQSLVLDDAQEAVGPNNRIELAAAEKVMQIRINEKWMLAGVTMIDPESVHIDADVTIGQDTIIYPNTYLRGQSQIGEDCEIGPDTIIDNTQVGSGVRILSSVLESAEVADRVTMGPFCHLRKGARLDEHVHLGNFAEVKDSYLGPGTKMGHFSYIGNAHIGSNVNIGAGTITCNYDGEKKNPTEVGDDVCLGSDTMLVAPVKIGDRAITGAGTVVTRDVSPDTLVLGVPARESRKLDKSD